MGDVWSMEQASGVTVEGQITDAIDEHDGDTGAHTDIRQAITNASTAASAALNTHNSSGAAHADIRTAITNASTAASAALSTHNASGSAHSDIRQAITDAGTAASSALSTHNSSGAAHADIRTLISDQSSAVSSAVAAHNGSGAAHSDIRQAIIDASTTASSALSTHNSSGAAHADLRAKALWVDQDTTGRVKLVIGEGLTSSYSEGVLTVSCPEGQSGTSLIEMHAVDGLSVPVSSGAWAKIGLPGIDTRETVVNVWEAVSPTPSYSAAANTLSSASQVEVVSSAVRLTQSGHILSRLVTTGTAGNRDAVPGVVWVSVGSPALDDESYVLSGNGLESGLQLPSVFTMELWVAASSGPGSVIASQSTVGGKSNCSFILSVVGGGCVDFGWSVNGSSFVAITSSSSVSNVERHIAITADGTVVKLWVNGTLEAQAAQGGDIYASTRKLRLGGEEGGMSFAGRIRDFRLSSTVLYSSAFSPADPLPGPVWAASGYGAASLQLGADDVTALTSITVDELQPGTSTVRYAFSFDDGVTWEKYASSAWSTLALNAVAASGMTAAQLSSALSAIEARMIASGAVTRVAYGLTTDGTYSPTALIAVDYTSAQEDLRVAGVHYDLRRGTEALFLRSRGTAFTSNVRVMG